MSSEKKLLAVDHRTKSFFVFHMKIGALLIYANDGKACVQGGKWETALRLACLIRERRNKAWNNVRKRIRLFCLCCCCLQPYLVAKISVG